MLGGEGAPVRRQAVAVPGFGETLALPERQACAAGNLPGAAPVGYVFFRLEEKHGLSGEDNVFVPARSRDGEMNNAIGVKESTLANGQLHGGVATCARSGDASVAAEHRDGGVNEIERSCKARSVP